jgi:hypothetical protein
MYKHCVVFAGRRRLSVWIAMVAIATIARFVFGIAKPTTPSPRMVAPSLRNAAVRVFRREQQDAERATLLAGATGGSHSDMDRDANMLHNVRQGRRGVEEMLDQAAHVLAGMGATREVLKVRFPGSIAFFQPPICGHSCMTRRFVAVLLALGMQGTSKFRCGSWASDISRPVLRVRAEQLLVAMACNMGISGPMQMRMCRELSASYWTWPTRWVSQTVS